MEYQAFAHGKNIQMNFNRDFNTLYMLNKDGYYMFIVKTSSKKLKLLNGEAIKNLDKTSVEYYYNNMNKVINYLKEPLENYYLIQKDIASKIKSIGGNGYIHGSIIDIDYYNHLFINPLDLSITPYYAENIVNKYIYKDLPTLLKENCPKLYENYIDKQLFITVSPVNIPDIYNSKKWLCEDTQIYKLSLEIKKMQKLKNNILSIWIEPHNDNNTTILDSKKYLT